MPIVIIIDYLWTFDFIVLLKNHRSFQINHLLVEFSVRSSSIPFNKSPTKFFLNYTKGDYVVICANEFLASRYELYTVILRCRQSLEKPQKCNREC